MISGGGRTVLNLLDAIERSDLVARIALVISSSADVAGVQRCRDRGLLVEVMPGVIAAERLGAVLEQHAIDAVVLAGFLKLLRIPEAYRGRIVNIHPALLPKFGGKGMHGDHVHAAVLAAGETETGCTVHLVDDTYDTGKVLLQKRCPVLRGDDVKMLAARVFEVESEAYPEALRNWLPGQRGAHAS
jgi:formyltetrahydrofolate-dependent phosphoribosylglycinamide formyltransferase